MKKVAPHQSRVFQEKADLDEKLLKLAMFIEGKVFKDLPKAERGRLQRQFLVMELYSQVLHERIAAFKV